MARGPSDQKSVHQGNMIGYQQGAPLRRNMPGAQDSDAIQGEDQAADAEAYQGQGYHTNSVSRDAATGRKMLNLGLLNFGPMAAYPLHCRLALKQAARRGE